MGTIPSISRTIICSASAEDSTTIAPSSGERRSNSSMRRSYIEARFSKSVCMDDRPTGSEVPSISGRNEPSRYSSVLDIGPPLRDLHTATAVSILPPSVPYTSSAQRSVSVSLAMHSIA